MSRKRGTWACFNKLKKTKVGNVMLKCWNDSTQGLYASPKIYVVAAGKE